MYYVVHGAETGNCDGVAYVSALNNCLTNSSVAPALTPNYGAFLTCALLPDADSCCNDSNNCNEFGGGGNGGDDNNNDNTGCTWCEHRPCTSAQILNILLRRLYCGTSLPCCSAGRPEQVLKVFSARPTIVLHVITARYCAAKADAEPRFRCRLQPKGSA
jgi:hypothetical protein